MDTENYCKTLLELDRITAIRAIHEAFLQLDAIGERVTTKDGSEYCNAGVITRLEKCLKDAGHIGFTD